MAPLFLDHQPGFPQCSQHFIDLRRSLPDFPGQAGGGLRSVAEEVDLRRKPLQLVCRTYGAGAGIGNDDCPRRLTEVETRSLAQASAGEALPAKTFEAWSSRFKVPLLDGIGGTEMLHVFISNRVGDAAAGAAGRPVTGYEVRIVDEQLCDVPQGEVVWV